MATKKRTRKETNAKKKSSGKKLWPWLLVVVLLAVGVIGGFVYIKYKEYQDLLALQAAQQQAQAEAEEQQRLEVYRKHQKDMKLCGELLFELNHALKEEPQDREKLLRLMARLTDRWSGMTHYEELLFREG